MAFITRNSTMRHADGDIFKSIEINQKRFGYFICACIDNKVSACGEEILMTRFKIFRFTPELDNKPWYETYELEVDSNTRILDCLHIIRDSYDPSLAYRWSCSHGICGSCGVTINGLAALACQKLVKHYVQVDEIKIDPLGFFPIVKDLIVDMEVFFEP